MKNNSFSYACHICRYYFLLFISVIPWPYFGSYTASKYAIEGFSLSLMEELKADGISVHLVRPSGHRTNILSAEAVNQNWMDSFNKQSEAVKKRYA